MVAQRERLAVASLFSFYLPIIRIPSSAIKSAGFVGGFWRGRVLE
jgi:hypothetical protein